MTAIPSDTRIEDLVRNVRLRLGVPDDQQLDIEDLIRRAKYVGYLRSVRVGRTNELGPDAARWKLVKREIVVSKAVMDGIKAGDPESCFVFLHELGHAILGHAERSRRADFANQQFGRFRESDEVDADSFARTMMAPEYLAENSPSLEPHALSKAFGLPAGQAQIRSDELQRRLRKRLGLTRQLPNGFNPLIIAGDVEVEEAYDRYINALFRSYKA